MPPATRRIRPPLTVALLAATLLSTTTPLTGQDSTAVAAGEWRVGGSVGVPGLGREAFPPAFTVGVHFTRVPSTGPGLDLSVGTSPYALARAAFILGARGAITFPVEAGSAVLLPGGGVSYVGIAANDGDAALGGHVGAAAIGAGGLRGGLTVHWFGRETWPVWLLELGYQPLRKR